MNSPPLVLENVRISLSPLRFYKTQQFVFIYIFSSSYKRFQVAKNNHVGITRYGLRLDKEGQGKKDILELNYKLNIVYHIFFSLNRILSLHKFDNTEKCSCYRLTKFDNLNKITT